MAGKLTEKDHRQMDKFLGDTFDAVKTGSLNRHSFIGGMAQVIAAIDIGNHGEALAWFEAGAKTFKLDKSKLSGGDPLG